MGGYIFQEFVSDFSGRTKQNIRVIDSIYNEHDDNPDKKVYEVTQLINSLFGMIILPYEKYNNQINESDYKYESSYKEIQELIKILISQKFLRSTYSGEHENIEVFKFIKHLRNALAHSGNGKLNFYPVNSNKDNIKAVYFMDSLKNQDGKVCTFCCRLSVKRIKTLCELIPELYSVVEKKVPENQRGDIFEKYYKQISALDNFINGDDAEIPDIC